jgi:F-type H+-transporting ATPase subunit delta
MSALASRYARAFADVVEGKKLDAGTVRAELAALVEIVQSSAELRRLWQSPAIAGEEKRKVLDELVRRTGASRWVRNFLAVLIDQRRIAHLGVIARQFEQELNARLGMAEAEVMSSRPLADDEKRRLEAEVEKLTGKKVRARYREDASTTAPCAASCSASRNNSARPSRRPTTNDERPTTNDGLLWHRSKQTRSRNSSATRSRTTSRASAWTR